MKEHCYPDLVEVFYTNLTVVNGVIHSRVKGVNITIDDNVWLDIGGLKAEGLDSHVRDSESNRWLTKRAIYINCLRYPRRYRVDKQYLHDGLNKEEKMIAYVLTWGNWDIPNDERIRKKILSHITVRWRDFKTSMTRQYVFGSKQNDTPCTKYKITEQEWVQFKESRLTPE
ncbi:hypothetical protein LR48_Vigan05g061500 [Vigna angularis]|uniref:Uncharacterized protein n=1 Tax=Phaseolus angularis TaxID=3914 RepID=A0A0L9UK07_PHAAN|nr:hypothetical protein LR48_Vigan05g061500 [Vigna angularis]